MDYRILGSKIEYFQAVKRLEQIAYASPNTPEAQELKELMQAFIHFEKEINRNSINPNQKGNKK